MPVQFIVARVYFLISLESFVTHRATLEHLSTGLVLVRLHNIDIVLSFYRAVLVHFRPFQLWREVYLRLYHEGRIVFKVYEWRFLFLILLSVYYHTSRPILILVNGVSWLLDCHLAPDNPRIIIINTPSWVADIKASTARAGGRHTHILRYIKVAYLLRLTLNIFVLFPLI